MICSGVKFRLAMSNPLVQPDCTNRGGLDLGGQVTIAHLDSERRAVIVDLLHGWQGSRKAPLKLGDVMPELKAICERYRIYTVLGDQFGAEPLKDAFTRYNLSYEERTFTNQSKADIYATLRSRVQDGTIELLDHEASLRELRALELENLPGGGLRIGHPRHGHDDFADAIALAVSEASLRGAPAFCMSASGPLEAIKMWADYDKWASDRSWASDDWG